MKFKIAYFIYLVISLFYGVVPIYGAITLRHIFTVLMLVVCFYEGGLKLDKFLKWYLVFMFFYVMIEIDTGYTSTVVNRVLGTYLASIALYLATKIMVKKYDGGALVIIALVGLALINSIVAIGQFLDSSIAETIPEILHIKIPEGDTTELFEAEITQKEYVSGLMGIVISGYFLSATCVLALYNRRGRIAVYNWIAFAVIFVALVFVQERSGLAAGAVCTFLFLSIVSIRFRSNMLTIGLVIVIAVYLINRYGSQFVSFEDLRYTSMGMEDDNRIEHALNALKWVWHNPYGGASFYYDSGGYYPHNVFANALLYGGVFGGTVVIGILMVQLVKIGQVCLSYIQGKTKSVLLVVSCMAYLCYTINSFFHNFSLVLGGEMIFLLWAMISSLLDKEGEACDNSLTKSLRSIKDSLWRYIHES